MTPKQKILADLHEMHHEAQEMVRLSRLATILTGPHDASRMLDYVDAVERCYRHFAERSYDLIAQVERLNA